MIQGVDFPMAAAEELVHCDGSSQASVDDVTSSLGEVKVECFEVAVGQRFFEGHILCVLFTFFMCSIRPFIE